MKDRRKPRKRPVSVEIPCKHDLANRDTEDLRAETIALATKPDPSFWPVFWRYLREEPIHKQIALAIVLIACLAIVCQ